MFVPPLLTRRSASWRKRNLWPDSILGSALEPASKKLLTSRQPDSVSAEASDMKAVLSSPMSG
ncbi:MAG: hypothetical protein ACRDIB_11655, partial [Ardenticatenaceae bacterium]